MTARWRKEPNETGLRSAGQVPRGLELRKNGETLITVAPIGGGPIHGKLRGWYWYGLDQNTAHAPRATIEDAKAEAVAFYKKWRAEQGAN